MTSTSAHHPTLTASLRCSLANFIGLVCLVGTSISTSNASALLPSFDCYGELTAIERYICNDPILSELDVDLHDTYTDLLEQIDSSEKDQLIQDHREWLNNREDVPLEYPSIKDIYRQRFTELLDKKYELVRNQFADESTMPMMKKFELAAIDLVSARLFQDLEQTVFREFSDKEYLTWEEAQSLRLKIAVSLCQEYAGDQLLKTNPMMFQYSGEGHVDEQITNLINSQKNKAFNTILASVLACSAYPDHEQESMLDMILAVYSQGWAGKYQGFLYKFNNCDYHPSSAEECESSSAQIEKQHRETARIKAKEIAEKVQNRPRFIGDRGGQMPHEDAIDLIDSDPALAESILTNYSTPDEALDYILFLHTFLEPSSRPSNVVVSDILTYATFSILENMEAEEKEFVFPVFGIYGESQISSYDGSSESLFPALLLSGKTIPCQILMEEPEFLKVIEPRWGSNRDNFLPRSGCRDGSGSTGGFPSKEIKDLIESAACCDGDFINSYYREGGSLVHYHTAGQNAAVDSIAVEVHLNDTGSSYFLKPYEIWSYLSLWNRQQYLGLVPVYERARDALAKFFQDRRGLDSETSYRLASHARKPLFGHDCGGGEDKLLQTSIRKLILDGEGIEAVKGFVERGQHLAKSRTSLLRACSGYAGIDPLIHIAVSDEEILKYLIENRVGDELGGVSRMNPDGTIFMIRDFDLELDVDTPNKFNKTPLMTAAQYDRVASANYLIKAGANLDSQTDSSNDYPELTHDNRTALMYAAAFGSLEMIKLLVEAGAKTELQDSRGITAFGYLRGDGPVERNSTLTSSEFEEATKMLATDSENTSSGKVN